MRPRGATTSTRKRTNAGQKSPPGSSSRTIGAGDALPVCTSVSSSIVSSSVPNPPGSETKPFDSFISISLRVKKYFIDTSFSSPAMNGFAACSNGSRMLTPNA